MAHAEGLVRRLGGSTTSQEQRGGEDGDERAQRRRTEHSVPVISAYRPRHKRFDARWTYVRAHVRRPEQLWRAAATLLWTEAIADTGPRSRHFRSRQPMTAAAQ